MCGALFLSRLSIFFTLKEKSHNLAQYAETALLPPRMCKETPNQRSERFLLRNMPCPAKHVLERRGTKISGLQNYTIFYRFYPYRQENAERTRKGTNTVAP